MLNLPDLQRYAKAERACKEKTRVKIIQYLQNQDTEEGLPLCSTTAYRPPPARSRPTTGPYAQTSTPQTGEASIITGLNSRSEINELSDSEEAAIKILVEGLGEEINRLLGSSGGQNLGLLQLHQSRGIVASPLATSHLRRVQGKIPFLYF